MCHLISSNPNIKLTLVRFCLTFLNDFHDMYVAATVSPTCTLHSLMTVSVSDCSSTFELGLMNHLVSEHAVTEISLM